MTYYNDTPPNRDDQLKSICRIGFLITALAGGIVFYVFGYDLLGGIGLGGSLFALASFFHINKDVNRRSQHIDTKMTWFLVGLTILGVMVLVGNHKLEGPPFYTGIAASLSLICGITYCIELIFTWSDSVSKN